MIDHDIFKIHCAEKKEGTCLSYPNCWGCNSYLGSIESSTSILDSGNRREFITGAVRDIQEGKGREDLLPLDVLNDYIKQHYASSYDDVLGFIKEFMDAGDHRYLYRALDAYVNSRWTQPYTMILEVAIHFEEGAKKYGEFNWQKGIPVRCYIDSALRHYFKYRRGDTDEPHDRAFCWNLLCAIWTCKHKPELNEYMAQTAEENNGNT